uniref:ABC transporter ATP-binding protein n=1 Tax=Candidatus Fimenecus sp. TaxID=3022888 RepID=UPI003FF06DB1
MLALVPYYYIWLVMKEVLDVNPDFDKAQNLAHNGWMAVIFAVIAVLIYIAGLMCSHMGAFRVATNMRIDTMEHIVRLPLGFAESFGSGKLRKIVNEASAATETYLAHQLPDKAGAIATPLGLIVLLFVFDWRLGILSLVPVILGFLIMMKMTGPRMEQKMKEYQNALDDMSNEAVEYIRGIPVVKTFGQTIFSFKKFKDSIDRYRVWVIAYTKELRAPMMFYTAAINGVFAFLIAGGLLFTSQGVTDEFLLNLIFYIIITPIISVTLTKIMFQSENAMIVADSLSRIDSVLNLDPLSEPREPKSPKDSSVELKNISFSYDGKKDVLKDISLTIPAGATVAFVGPSGGGKTTLANIISRFFDPKSGSVSIGGVDVKDISKEELMNTVSFVFQNSHLVKDSVFENVRMGKQDATREEVMDALEKAQCMDIIEKLPQGVDTVIGTKGVYLSGGEQQRIAIARVMLKNSPVIILDEATAFADPDNESRVQAAFSNLSKNKTVIMIAHRLSTVADVDKIYVLADGRIAESGSGASLIEEKGLFSKMWNDYQTSVKWKVEKEA